MVKSYESLFLEKGILTKGVKGSGRLGLHNIMGCKILIIPYGGDVVGTNIDDVYGHYFFPNALFFDYKGGRKKKFKKGLERAKAKYRENKGQFVDNDDFINFNNNNAMNEHTIKELKGFSGSKIYLMRNDNGLFIRKMDNVDRNFIKLNELSQHFNVTKIYSFNNNILDMEYIHGLDMKSYLAVRDTKRLTEFLINVLLRV